MFENRQQLIDYLKIHYPNMDNKILCQKLNLSPSALRTLASRNNIYKSKAYRAKQHQQMMKAKEEKYLASIPNVQLSIVEQNIIVGSLLGDGSLTFSARSRNAYYREHFSEKQREYREWKMENINSLTFRIEKGNHLKSPSHPVFTDLYNKFYINNKRSITKDNIKLLNHPIGLACLYLDDGTLMLNVSEKSNTFYITPSIGISTLCFSEKECIILRKHILNQFNIEFRLNSHPSGKGCTLVCSKLDYVDRFYDLIHPYCKEISTLRYKWDKDYRVQKKKKELELKYRNTYRIRISTIHDIPPRYSPEDEESIIYMKTSGYTDQQIADALDRPYWGIVDKIRRMRKAGKLKKKPERKTP